MNNSALRTQHSALSREARDRWMLRMKVAGIVIFILSAFGIVGTIEMQAEQASQDQVHQAMQRAAAARELERGLRKCPPPGEGMTDVVVMIVKYTADADPTVERCLRFAEARYLPRRQSTVPPVSALSTQNSELSK